MMTKGKNKSICLCFGWFEACFHHICVFIFSKKKKRKFISFSLSPVDCTMKRRANTCGSVQLSIIHSFDCVHPYVDRRHGKISFAWDLGFVIRVKRNSRQLFKVKPGVLYNLNGDPHNDLLGVNRMCCVNDNVMFSDQKVIRPQCPIEF